MGCYRVQLAAEERGDDGDGAANDIMTLIERIVHSIARDQQRVRVIRRRGERHDLIEIAVAEHDRGALIGRGGQVIEAIRTIVATASRGSGRVTRVMVID